MVRTKLLKQVATALGFALLSITAMAQQTGREVASFCPDWQQTTLGKLHSSKQLELCKLMQDRPVLVVNTASHCGFTRQFSGLEALHQKYRDRGLVVIGFPSNDFNQEAASAAKTAEVCFKNYGVSFTMTEAVNVRGPDALPLFRHLAQQKSAPTWNFNKYLIDAQGRVHEHFPSTVEPDSKLLLQAIERLL